MAEGRSITYQESLEERGRESPIGSYETDDEAGERGATRSDVEHQIGRDESGTWPVEEHDFVREWKAIDEDLIDDVLPARFRLVGEHTRDRQIGAFGIEPRSDLDLSVRKRFLPLSDEEVMELVRSHQIRDPTDGLYVAEEVRGRRNG
jgi:hypothetical protein